MTDHSSVFSGDSSKNTGDTNAKRILKYRIVLANILKYAIPKYNSYSVEEIMKMIPASSKTPDGLYVQDLEDSKHIAFDLLFPIGERLADKVDIWCDIEPQTRYMVKSDNKQSYDLASRGVYYLSRMLSRQLSSGGELSGYAQLHKCYSIWICFDNIDNRSWEPSVTRYTFSPAKLLKEDKEPPERERNAADLLELIIVRAGGNTDDTKSLVGLINTLWRDVSNIPEYIPETYEGFNSIRKETAEMCDMRDVWIAEGTEKGEIKNAIKVVHNLLDLKFSFDDALKIAGIDEKTYSNYKYNFSSNDKL